jgi:hypothetical protein
MLYQHTGRLPTKNRLPVRVDFDVQGVGPWTRELSIYVPTAEQMAERAKMLAGMPWLADALRGKPAYARAIGVIDRSGSSLKSS